jgi:hypothetical protein
VELVFRMTALISGMAPVATVDGYICTRSTTAANAPVVTNATVAELPAPVKLNQLPPGNLPRAISW